MIVDIVLIVIIGVCIFLGYIRGFAKVAIKIIGFIASIIIALILYTPVSNYIINNTEIVNNLSQTIQEKIYAEEQNDEEEEPAKNISAIMEKYVEDYANEIKSSTSQYISKAIAVSFVKIGTWIALFLIARIIMIFLKIFANIIEKIPVIKQFNKVRRNNIRNFRGICCSLYSTCYNKFDIAFNKRQ